MVWQACFRNPWIGKVAVEIFPKDWVGLGYWVDCKLCGYGKSTHTFNKAVNVGSAHLKRAHRDSRLVA